MDTYIEQAKVMPKGQITIPLEIRKLLQIEMKGEAQKNGILNEDDVQKLLEENRWEYF